MGYSVMISTADFDSASFSLNLDTPTNTKIIKFKRKIYEFNFGRISEISW